ncbi:PSD1 and planctomycete cytochrome C domain-containing protein [Planctomicrobium piriforme]|uniref:Planctomycete cytochrome C n=1 Tax=Planctomicrobium piriforme TaxID=1576369 RepID=A0A1I3B4E3_9PLAN|nr:PSD1 and planctomycete cytochrome C domain-containing protein [Planctomicrobium piriforme]SFH57092.1 Planctomycete cytochrome C [Planctomicrobium piriforme]
MNISINHCASLSLILLLLAASGQADDTARQEFFEQKIRPVLVESCYPCHAGTPDEVEGKLWLDSRAGWQRGGQSGTPIVPGKPEESLLVRAIRHADKDLAMPPEEKLSDAVIADFVIWIRQGAFDPRDQAATSPPRPIVREMSDRERWAFSRPVKPALPVVRDETWAKQPLDRFLLARLEAQQLLPADAATPEQLVRRLYWDLIGLPPSPEEVDRFLAAAQQDRQQAVVGLVNDLLSRPAYGEKWGRYWLDCVRYADLLDARNKGGEGDIVDAWRYRDWVVQAFNSDLSYNEFMRRQIAGDLLAQKQWNADNVIATGLYAIGNWGNGDSDKQKVYTDIVDDQIDVTGRAFLGLTLACARCHDHKFDPISTADYYSLAGFFFSSRILDKFAHPTQGEKLMRIDLVSPEDQKRRDELTAQIAAINAKLNEGLTPLSAKKENVSGKPELISWSQPGIDNPSLTVNRSDQPVAFSTVSLPAKSLSVHPGPEHSVTVVWRAPVDGEISISAQLSDADGNCGDGIDWAIRLKDQTLQSGTLANGASAGPIQLKCNVQASQLVRLTIAPRGDYVCDSTRIDLQISHAASDKTWKLSESVQCATFAEKPQEEAFAFFRGDGETLRDAGFDEAPLIAERNALTAKFPEVIKCQGLQDGGIPETRYAGFHDVPIHVRGDYRRLTSVQPRGFPKVFQADSPAMEGSGRLQLADWIAAENHPLTARVFVNRLWQHHFGRGIVTTANNFGALGTPPTHPELLDWLAVTFIEQGWSVKEMHRLICTSAAYQQSTLASRETLERDPDNLLFSRQQRRKLTAEELRDGLLCASGQLDLTLGGPSIADLNVLRRTLYLTTLRSDRASYQLLFDGADPTSVVEQRTDSIVAPQALWLMNHPFVLGQSRKLAERIQSLPNADNTARVQELFKRLYGRPARPEEAAVLAAFLEQQTDPAKGWETVCHVLLCANEFVFVD